MAWNKTTYLAQQRRRYMLINLTLVVLVLLLTIVGAWMEWTVRMHIAEEGARRALQKVEKDLPHSG